MVFVPALNVAKAEMRFTWQSQIVENIYYFQKATALSKADSDNIGGAMVTHWNGILKTDLPVDISFEKVHVTDLTTQNSPAWDYTQGLPLPGTGAANASMPSSVTGAMSFLTGLRGRSYMGRIYVVGLYKNAVTGNLMSTGFRDTWYAFITALENTLTAQGLTHVVVSNYHNGAARQQAVVTPVTGHFMGLTLDNQRRRLPARGR